MPGMTPKRQPQRGSGPQAFTPRASSKMPGSVRRALDGQIESRQRNGDTLEVSGGRLEVRAGAGLKQTRQGLVVDMEQVGEKNRPPLKSISDLSSSSTAAQVATAFNDLLSALRKTGNMRG